MRSHKSRHPTLSIAAHSAAHIAGRLWRRRGERATASGRRWTGAVPLHAEDAAEFTVLQRLDARGTAVWRHEQIMEGAGPLGRMARPGTAGVLFPRIEPLRSDEHA